MKTIIMDTSNTYLVVALYEDDRCLEAIQEQGNKKQSEYAIIYLQQLLQKHNTEMLEIEEMIITIGPGSYTGERVALTIAKTLAATTTIKVKAVSSLAAYAGMKKAISVLDARSKKIYVGVYENGQSIVADQLIDIDNFADFYKEYQDYSIVGDGELVGFTNQEVNLSDTIFTIAKTLDYITNVDVLVPHYIKEVEAKKIC